MKKQSKTPRTISTKLSKEMLAWRQTERDFKDALLVVSLIINIFILCLWVALRVTSHYDSALAHFFFGR